MFIDNKMTKGLREGRCARSLLATVSYAHLVKGGVELHSQKNLGSGLEIT